MTIRRKNGRAVVVSAPQTAAAGRRAPLAVATGARLPLEGRTGATVTALALALAELAHAHEEEREHPSDARVRARQKAQRRVREVRAKLSTLVGRSEALAIAARLDVDGGLLLAAVGKAAPLARPHAMRAVLDGGRIAAEHGLGTASASATLARSLRWQALAGSLLDLLLQHAPGTKEWSELARLANVAGQSARLDLLAALTIERQTSTERDAGFDAGGIDAGFAAELLARGRERARPATGSPEDATGDPEPHRAQQPNGKAQEGPVPAQQNTSATRALSTESRDSVGARRNPS